MDVVAPPHGAGRDDPSVVSAPWPDVRLCGAFWLMHAAVLTGRGEGVYGAGW